MGFLCLLLPLGARAEVSSPFNLGAAGLSLQVRIWKQPAATPGVPVAQSVSGVVIGDIGSGDYILTGLPDAAGRDRYTAVVTTTEEPTRALNTYTYGARPGVAVVFKQEVSAVTGTTIVQGDTFGTVSVVVRTGLPSGIASATATFYMTNASTGTALVSARPATISNVLLDATTSTYGCTLTYQLESAASATVGTYLAEFRITMVGGAILTLPMPQPLRLSVRAKL